MALTARYTKPLQIVAEPELAARFLAIAEAERVSVASVYRDVLWAGIRDRERLSQQRTVGAGE